MIKQRIRQLEAVMKRLVAASRPAVAVAPWSLQSVQDLIDVIEEQVEAVRTAPECGTIEKARAVAYLAGVARKTMEANILATRLEMLEMVLKQRKAEDRR